MKLVMRALPWTSKIEWAWPDGDTQLLAVFDEVADVETILAHVERHSHFRFCVQAGGAAGVWPKRFAMVFDHVMTFEPNPLCFECLIKNAPESNVYHYPFALGSHDDVCEMAIPPKHDNNVGAWYARVGVGAIPVRHLDAFALVDVGLIQLDVEGGELAALIGAQETIARCRPVIVLEEKPLPHLPVPTARRYLEAEFGYTLAEKIHNDVIMVP